MNASDPMNEGETVAADSADVQDALHRSATLSAMLATAEPEAAAEAVPTPVEASDLGASVEKEAADSVAGALDGGNRAALNAGTEGEAEAEAEVEPDLIEGTLQYLEAKATLRAWLQAAGVEGSCLEKLQRRLEEGEGEFAEKLYSLGRFRRGWTQLVAAGRISIGTLHLVENALAAEALVAAEP